MSPSKGATMFRAIDTINNLIANVHFSVSYAVLGPSKLWQIGAQSPQHPAQQFN